jgi:phosphate-selective porin OprO/OprP
MRLLGLISTLWVLGPMVATAASLEDLLVERGVISRREALAATAAGSSKTYWNKGTKIEFPDSGFTVGVNSFIESRYTFTNNDEDSGQGNTSSFTVNRARLIVSGKALNEEFAYKLEGDFVGGKGSTGATLANIKDGYLEWRMCDWVSARLGQFKTNLGRQHLNSDTSLQLIDRSLVSDYFTLDRQSGALLTSKLAGGEVVVTAGIFNGESEGESGPNRSGVDTNHTGIVSVRWNPVGKMNAFQEGDIDWTEDLAVSLGASYGYLDSKNSVAADLPLESFSQDLVAVDAGMKYRGWSVNAELFSDSLSAEEVGADAEPHGFYVQAGFFVEPKTLEVAARYSYLDCDDGVAGGDCSGNESVNEVAVGLNYLLWRHHLKAQANYVRAAEDGVAGGADITTNKWQLQLSAFF